MAFTIIRLKAKAHATGISCGIPAKCILSKLCKRPGRDAVDNPAVMHGPAGGLVGMGEGIGAGDGAAECGNGGSRNKRAGRALVAATQHALAQDAGHGAGDR